MLKLSKEVLSAILSGDMSYGKKVMIQFQSPETYTEDNYLDSIRGINMSMSDDGGYEASNTSITLKNTDRYFSKFFARELPIKKAVQIFFIIAGIDVEVFKGIVADWKLTKESVELNINI